MAECEAPTKKPFEIAIVGGGIGGVCLAVGLLGHGVPFKIYESAASFGEIGAGVAFGANAMRALGLISVDLLDAFRRHATSNEDPDKEATMWTIRCGQTLADHDKIKVGDILFDIDNEDDTHSWTKTKARSSVHRAKFLDEIIKLVPKDATTFKKSLTHLEEVCEKEGGGVRLYFADGSSAFANAVVGCDGIKSKTRSCLYGDKIQPTYSGEYVYRSMIPWQAYEASVGRVLALNANLYAGYGKYIVSYPVDHGNIINTVMCVTDRNPHWEHETWLKPTSEEEMRSEVQGMHPEIVDLMVKHGTRDKWAIHDIIHGEKYCKGRACLLGDSAHASVPHMAAGAGMAVEDAYVLCNLLGATRCSEDLPNAFEAYDAVRRPRSQRSAQYSRLNGQDLALSEEGVGDDVEKVEQNMTMRWRWLWDADLEAHLQEALANMTKNR